MKRLVGIKQRDISDCGAACLASVSAYFGLRIPVSRIRHYAGTDKLGTSLLGLTEAADSLNIEAKAVRAKGVSLKDIPMPSIYHLFLNEGYQHFVVVYKVNTKQVVYMDPAVGKFIRKTISDFESAWSGVILLLLPTEKFRKGNEIKTVYRRFWHLIFPQRKLMFQALFGALVCTLLGLSTSIFVQKIIDLIIPDSNRHLLNLLGIVMILLLIFRTITGYFKSLLILKIGQHIDSRLILGYCKHLLELPQRFFDRMRVGEIVSRVNDAFRLRIFISDVALGVIIHALTIIFCVTVMIIYHWKLAMIIILAILIYMIIYLINNRVNTKWQRKLMENAASLESHLVESIQGMTTIRRFGVQSYFNFKTETKFTPLGQAVFNSSRAGLMLANTSDLMTSVLTISILWAGGNMVVSRVLSSGELVSFYTLTAFFTASLQAVLGANRSMQDAIIAADRLFEIMDLESENEHSGIEEFPVGDITFENIHFCYDRGNPVFRGLHFRIHAFKLTGITGESGSGKSTMLSLLQKLYPLDGGNILIGDVNIHHLSTALLRKKIAAVPQQTDFFQGTILSNIGLGQNAPDFKRIVDICRRLGIHEFISQLPGQYQTVIRENGINLSGGQKQRLGIARALYLNPSILILDEATSALDMESERKVKETLIWFCSQKKTIIVISHRPGTIKWCDSVVFFKPGRLPVSGSHVELLDGNPDYARWWETCTV